MIEPGSWVERVLWALGNSLLHSFWQAGVVWLLVLLILYAIKPVSTKRIEAIGFAATILTFCSFVFTFFYLVFSKTAVYDRLLSFQSEGLAFKIFHLLAVAYLVIFIFQLVRLVIGVQKIHRLRRFGLERVPGHIKIFALDASSYLGITRKVQVYFSHLVDSPITFGFLKPVILLPFSIATQLSAVQLEAILLHELAHIKRNDYVINWINQLVKVVLYFNPFVMALIRFQQSEREKNADRWVMQFEYDPKIYATALYQIAQLCQAPKPQFVLPVLGNSYELLNRIECILGKQTRLLPGARTIATNIGVLLFCFALSIISPRGTEFKQKSSVSQSLRNTGSLLSSGSLDGVEVRKISKSKNVQARKWVARNLPATTSPQKHSLTQENPKSEIAGEESSNPIPAQYVKATTTKLSDSEEQTIDAAVKAAARIYAEESWKHIELQLAESMTDQQKLAFKNRYVQVLTHANWPELENRLRTRYTLINWDSVGIVLQAEVQDLLIDSLYNHYTLLERQLASAQRNTNHQIPSLPGGKEEMENAIEKALPVIKNFLEQVDSLRRKKIIEL